MGDRGQNPAAVPAVAIVGCGNIGSAYDEGAAEGPVLTHAAAYLRTGRARLVALCDPDRGRLEQAGRARCVEALYVDVKSMLDEQHVDILSICTPTRIRASVIEAALRAGVRSFWLEKPVAGSLSEARSLAQMLHGSVVAVNYLRRWDPIVSKVAAEVKAGAFGTVRHVVARYGKGVVNNGTHMFDLLRSFLGEPSRVQALRRIDDGFEDPTLDLLLQFGDTPVHMLATDHRQVSLFELDVVADGGRVHVSDRGFTLVQQRSQEDPLFAGYRRLSPPVSTPTRLGDALVLAANEIIDGNTRCTLRDGIRALAMADAALQSFTTGQAVDLTTEGSEE